MGGAISAAVAVRRARPILPELVPELRRARGEVAARAHEPLVQVPAEHRRAADRLAEEPELAEVGLGERQREVDADDEPPLRPLRLLGEPAGEPRVHVAAAGRVGERAPQAGEPHLRPPALDLGGEDLVARALDAAPAEADDDAAIRQRHGGRARAAEHRRAELLLPSFSDISDLHRLRRDRAFTFRSARVSTPHPRQRRGAAGAVVSLGSLSHVPGSLRGANCLSCSRP